MSGKPSFIMPAEISILGKKYRFIDLFVLGIIAMMLITSSLFGAVNASAVLRQKGAIKKLTTAPITHTDWILSNVQRQFLLSVIATIAILSVSYGMFHLSLKINVWLPVFVVLNVYACVGVGMILTGVAKGAESSAQRQATRINITDCNFRFCRYNNVQFRLVYGYLHTVVRPGRRILSKGNIMAGIEIITVKRKTELKDFINLPWKIYAAYPKWVPPLKKEVRRLLDPVRHPFWESAERVLFLARRGSVTIGRIAGIIDRKYNQFHNEKMGIWGFFECAEDPQAAAALFSAVETWARQKAMTFLRGPLNPSTNYEVGLLIEGFDYLPALMMPYNPPYYSDLIESCGFAKEKDLLAFLIDGNYHLPDWMDSLAARLARKNTIRIRCMNPKDADTEFAILRDIYNESWSENWGFVPLSKNEIHDIQKNVIQFADPDMAFFIYYENEPVAVCVIFPDMNPLLKRLNGHIGLMGLLKTLLYRHEIKGMRMLIFGIKEQYRQMGIPILAFHHIYDLVRSKKRYNYLEVGWTLEDNDAINSLIEESGARAYKKYRIFRKSL